MVVADKHRRHTDLDGSCVQYRAPRLQCTLALLVVAVGAYGQIHDSMHSTAFRWSDLHLGFGALLLCTVVLRLRSRIARPMHDDTGESYAVRHLSRLVYLLLYVLAGLREVANIGVYLGLGGTLDLGWMVVGHAGAGTPPLLSTMDSFLIYVIYGTTALILIRVKPLALADRVQLHALRADIPGVDQQSPR